jgi:hypothetical protein
MPCIHLENKNSSDHNNPSKTLIVDKNEGKAALPQVSSFDNSKQPQEVPGQCKPPNILLDHSAQVCMSRQEEKNVVASVAARRFTMWNSIGSCHALFNIFQLFLQQSGKPFCCCIPIILLLGCSNTWLGRSYLPNWIAETIVGFVLGAPFFETGRNCICGLEIPRKASLPGFGLVGGHCFPGNIF